MKQLIIGGARSGKSTLAKDKAQAWQKDTGGEVTLIVTAKPDGQPGSEMSKRIVHHQLNRPSDWHVVEAWQDLAGAIASVLASKTTCSNLIMVDCLTLWVANELYANKAGWATAKKQLLDVIFNAKAPLIFIGNEVGQGVVPLGEFNRQFVDELGWLHQHLGRHMDTVTNCIAGLPLVLKGPALNARAEL